MAATVGLAVSGLVVVLALGAVVTATAAAASGQPAAVVAQEEGEGPPGLGHGTPDQLKATSEDHHYAEPNYHYRYAVASRKTGDVKGAWEKRAGKDVWGAYFLRDPDGHWRTVHYEADDSGFHATVQRRPLHGRKGKLQPGELTDADQQHLDPEQQGGEGGELEEAAWQEALLAAKESASEDNHPALQKAKKYTGSADETVAAPYQLDEEPSEKTYTSMRRPAPEPEPRQQPPVDKRSYTPAPRRARPRPVSYAGAPSSTTLRPTSYSSPPTSYFAGEPPRYRDDEEAPYDSGPAATYSHPSQGDQGVSYGSSSPSASYSAEGESSYRSTTGHPQAEDERLYDESSSTDSEHTTGGGASYSGSSTAYTDRPSEEDTDDSQYDKPSERPVKSESYRVSEDYRAQDDDRDRYRSYGPGSEGEDKEQQEVPEDEDRAEGEDGESEHNPDDDHELVPEQALQGSGQVNRDAQQLHRHLQQQQQLAQLHSVHMQAAQLRVPVVPPQATPVYDARVQQGQAQHHAVMEQLLGPAWSEVASHSQLFEGNDWPGLDRPAEVTAEDTKDVPTWVKKERAKARRVQQAQGVVGPARAVAQAERERGAAKYAAAPLTAVRLSIARPTSPTPADLPEAPRPTADWGPQWSFGSKSKVRGKEDGGPFSASASVASAQQQGHQRGAAKGHNRGPVLFAQHLSASTPAGDRRAPPRGYVPPQPPAVRQPAPPGRQHAPRGVSYSGWTPVTASLQVAAPAPAPAFGDKRSPTEAQAGRQGRSRGARGSPAQAQDAWTLWS